MYLMATTRSIGKLSTGYTNSTYTTDTLTLSLSLSLSLYIYIYIYIYISQNPHVLGVVRLGCVNSQNPHPIPLAQGRLALRPSNVQVTASGGSVRLPPCACML